MRNKYKLISLLLSLLFLLGMSPARSNPPLTDSQNKLVEHIRYITEDLGYRYVSLVSFKESIDGTALSSIYNNKKDMPIYIVGIMTTKHGAEMFFKNHKNCSLTDGNDVVSTIIKVDKQPINAFFRCVELPDSKNETQEVYVIKNAAGKEFVYQHFLNNEYVFVETSGLVIPFDTEGFLHAWDEANIRPL